MLSALILRRPFLLLSATVLLVAFSPATGSELPWIEHRVQCGECGDSIAETYGVSLRTIERANEVSFQDSPPAAGDKLLIPRTDGDLAFTMAEVHARRRGESFAASISREQTTRVELPAPVKRSPARQSDHFLRPVAGKISSPWGMRRGRLHDGVDIPAPLGTPILAARTGKVIFSGNLHGYGRTVTLDHGDGVRTRYSHNSANLVKVGDLVQQGQPLAKVGRTGRATCTHVHFSVIIDGKTVNPEKYLR